MYKDWRQRNDKIIVNVENSRASTQTGKVTEYNVNRYKNISV